MDLNYALTILAIIAIVAIVFGQNRIAEKAVDGIVGLAGKALAEARHFVREIAKGATEAEKAEEVSDLSER